MTNTVAIKDFWLPERRTGRLTITVADLCPARRGYTVAPPTVGSALVPAAPVRLPVPALPRALPEPEKFPFLHEGEGTVAITVPFGCERRKVNTVTFKALAGKPWDTLMRQEGERWCIVDDSELIDLSDQRVLYRLGPLQIYS